MKGTMSKFLKIFFLPSGPQMKSYHNYNSDFVKFVQLRM